jgi:subtilase family serine protease
VDTHLKSTALARSAAAARLKKLALIASGMALAGMASAAEAPSLSQDASLVARATTLRAGDVVGTRLTRTQPVHVTLALKLRNREGLDAFIAANSSGRGLGASVPMSAEQLAADHLPTAEQAQAVVRFLRGAGFRNIEVAANRLLVSADGNASSVESTFRTTMMQVTTTDGRDAIANTAAVIVPAELQDSVLSVTGLQTVHQAHVHSRVLSTDALRPLAVTGHNPLNFSPIYGGASVPTAAGVTVGIITQGKITQTITDLNSFTSNNGLATVTTQTVNTNGTSTDTSGLGEWNLDSQSIVGASGGQVGKIIFYNIPTLSTANLTADINTVVSANVAKIINVSLGLCETSAQSDGSAAAQDQSFAVAVAQGQTFSISTGDDGADECGTGGTVPSWPAASQYVMAISGTRLDASTTTWNSEVVWNDSSGATGGSQSTFEPKPSWQSGLVGGTTRGVADVAFDGAPASGATIIVNGGTQQIGGTSLSAPIFSGLWARVIGVKGTSVGFAAPLIYALPASDFHDVTSGNNSGVSAGPGYDLVTGRGSVILSSAITHIGGGSTGNVAPVANFTVATSGLTATFTDTSTDSDGTIASRSWNFGDGTTSTATNPSHTYSAAGTFTVTLTVTDNGGLTNTKSSSVTVANAGGTTFFQNTTPQAIPDVSTITSSIVVSGLTGPASSTLKVSVNISHTFRGDLKVDIIAPNGASANLWNRQGGSADNLVMTFTVNASSITSPNGTWKLRVADQAAGDVGTLNSWSLQF